MITSSPKQMLRDLSLKPKHHFGQNFLCHPDLSEKIAERIVQGQRGTVIEIGAGLGALTASLLRRADHVVAIERDRDLVPVLRETFEPSIADKSLIILEQDAKTTDYVSLFYDKPRPHLIAGNLPYQLTGPLLRRLVDLASNIERAVFMVQLEVSNRLCAAPGERCYGALTVFLRACYAVKRLLVVGRSAFYPQPKVDSAVVEMTPLSQFVAVETPLFRELVQLAFQHRRKKLSNAWGGLTLVQGSSLAAAATRCSIDLNLRGEMLSVVDFARMAKELTP